MIWLSPCTRSVKYCTYICRVYILHYNGMFIRLTLPLFGAIGIGEIMVWLRRYIVQWEGYSLLMIVCESMFWADKSPEELCWLTKLLLFLAGSACLITSFCSVFLFFLTCCLLVSLSFHLLLRSFSFPLAKAVLSAPNMHTLSPSCCWSVRLWCRHWLIHLIRVRPRGKWRWGRRDGEQRRGEREGDREAMVTLLDSCGDWLH